MVCHPEPFATPPYEIDIRFLTRALTLYYAILNSYYYIAILYSKHLVKMSYHIEEYIIPYTIPRTQHKLHPVNPSPSCGTQPDGARASGTHATLKVTDGFVNGTSIWHLPTCSWFTAWSQVILGGWKQVGTKPF